jgi:DNA-binding MarR family transcriptional regulator
MTTPGTVGYLLEHTTATLHRHTDQLLQERLGIGVAQFKLLVTLRDRPGLLQRTVAGHLNQTEASISRQVKLMRRKGLLLVTANPHNRREHQVVVTLKGARLAEVANDLIQEYYQTVFSAMDGKQQEQLRENIDDLHKTVCLASDDQYGCDLYAGHSSTI